MHDLCVHFNFRKRVWQRISFEDDDGVLMMIMMMVIMVMMVSFHVFLSMRLCLLFICKNSKC